MWRSRKFFYGVAVALAALVGWRVADVSERGSEGRLPLSAENAIQRTGSIGPRETVARVLPSGNSPLPKIPKTLEELLAAFEFTGDRAFLDQAAELDGSNPKVITTFALLAEAANSPWLKKLEQLDPKNSLPNLIRAGIYASKGQWTEFAKEIKLAADKPGLLTYGKERQAELWDFALRDGGNLKTELLAPQADQALFKKLRQITQKYDRESGLLGGSVNAAGIAAIIAKQLRSVDSQVFSYRDAANELEWRMLKKIPPETQYDETGITAGERMASLIRDDAELKKLGLQFADAHEGRFGEEIRSMFILRVRLDGEMEALRWLEKEVQKK